MPTYDTFTEKQSAGEQMHPAFREEWRGPVTLDFTGITIVASDVYEALKVKAGERTMRTNVKIVTPAAGTALTANVGTAGGSNMDAAIDLKGAAGTEYESAIGTDSGVAGGAGTLHSAADTLDFTFATVTDVTTNPVVEVRALVRTPYEISGYPA